MVGLYDAVPVRRTERLPVGHGHVLQVEYAGAEDGLPVLLLHGGPGSGQSPSLRRVFNPARYHVIAVDQRGAGASTPHGGTEHNTLAHLLADLRQLHAHLQARLSSPRWLVVGGSWGATLALAHAADMPQVVSGLLLRASFLARAEDVAAFFNGQAQPGHPAWASLVTASGADPDDSAPGLVQALANVLDHGLPHRQNAVAKAWWRWERLQAGQPLDDAPRGEALAMLVGRYRVQSHYLRHGCWLADHTLLQRAAQAPAVPTLLLHADNDRVCPPGGALTLQQALRGAQPQRQPHMGNGVPLHWVPGAGHNPMHPLMAAAQRRALDHFAHHRDWPAAPHHGLGDAPLSTPPLAS